MTKGELLKKIADAPDDSKVGVVMFDPKTEEYRRFRIVSIRFEQSCIEPHWYSIDFVCEEEQ